MHTAQHLCWSLKYTTNIHTQSESHTQDFNLNIQPSQWGVYKLEDVEMQEADNDYDYNYEEDMNASAMEVDKETP